MSERNDREEISDYSNNLSSPPQSSFVDKIKCMYSNFKYTAVLCCFKFRKQTNISILEFQVLRLKEKFGVDYLTLVGDNASGEDVKECLRTALEELDFLRGEIEDNLDQINWKEVRVNRKMHANEFAESLESPAVTTDLEGHSKKSTKTRHITTQKTRERVSSSSLHSDSRDFRGYNTEESTPSCEPRRKSNVGPDRTNRKKKKKKSPNSARRQ